MTTLVVANVGAARARSARVSWLLSSLVLGSALLVAVPASALPIGGIDGQPLPPIVGPPNDPVPPHPPAIVGRTTSSMDVRWSDTTKAGLPYRIVRMDPGAAVSIVAGGTVPASPVNVTDTGLLKDTTYCYHAEVDDPVFGSLSSSHMCSYTLTGQAVIRLQVELTTANVSDANTNDGVFVDIGGQRTWLDLNRDDFERGDTHRYDLALVADTADIRLLTLGKTGSDGWCVADLKLLVNGGYMFEQSFADQPGGCLWLDSEGGASLTYQITAATLRAHPLWSAYRAPLPQLTRTATGYTGSFDLSADELSARIEGMVGNAIHGTALYWSESGSHPGILPHPSLPNAVIVDVGVRADVWGPDPFIRIEFDLVFDLSQAAFGQPIDVSITDANLSVRATGSWDDDAVEKSVRAAWPGVDMSFQIDVDAILKSQLAADAGLAAYIGRCCDAFGVVVGNQGDVTLSASLSPRPRRDGIINPVFPTLRAPALR